MQEVRFGVLGTARIATKVGQAIRDAGGAELVAIGSRSLDSAQTWASEHGAVRAYGSYEEVLSDAALEAVYIPLPPSMHREWVIKAAEAGKHNGTDLARGQGSVRTGRRETTRERQSITDSAGRG